MSSSVAFSSFAIGQHAYQYLNLAKLIDTVGLPYSLIVLLENALYQLQETKDIEDILEAFRQWPATKVQIPFKPTRTIASQQVVLPILSDALALNNLIKKKVQERPIKDLIIPTTLIAESTSDMADNRQAAKILSKASKAFTQLQAVSVDKFYKPLARQRQLIALREHDSTLSCDTAIGSNMQLSMLNLRLQGLELEAALMGLAVPLNVPEVIGIRITGIINSTCTDTEIVSSICEFLEQVDSSHKILEFFGSGVEYLKPHIRNMIAGQQEQALAVFFPVDEQIISLAASDNKKMCSTRAMKQYFTAQGLWHHPTMIKTYSKVIELDLTAINKQPLKLSNGINAEPRAQSIQVALSESSAILTDPMRLKTYNMQLSDIRNGRILTITGDSDPQLPASTDDPAKLKGMPLIIFARKDCGQAKRQEEDVKQLVVLGVKAVIAESFCSLYRAGLVMMGILPLTFIAGLTSTDLNLESDEVIDIWGLEYKIEVPQKVVCSITHKNGFVQQVDLILDVRSSLEVEYLKSLGMLSYALRNYFNSYLPQSDKVKRII